MMKQIFCSLLLCSAIIFASCGKDDSTPAQIPVTGIVLDETTATLEAGKTLTLIATITPKDATDQTRIWSTNNPDIATVEAGMVTAVAPGEATITATTKDGGKTATCAITVITPVRLNDILFDKSSLLLTPGQQETLTLQFNPEGATNKKVSWATSASGIATVENGVVTAGAEGMATISATAADNNMTANCVVFVAENPVAVTGVTLNKTELTLRVGEKEFLQATVLPENATNKFIASWGFSYTSHPPISVSQEGLIIATGEGKSTVIVRTLEGDKEATCKVTVTADPILTTSIPLRQ